jgi:hypothetical protein
MFGKYLESVFNMAKCQLEILLVYQLVLFACTVCICTLDAQFKNYHSDIPLVNTRPTINSSCREVHCWNLKIKYMYLDNPHKDEVDGDIPGTMAEDTRQTKADTDSSPDIHRKLAYDDRNRVRQSQCMTNSDLIVFIHSP